MTADLAGATTGDDVSEIAAHNASVVSAWQNHRNRYDVTDDGLVTSRDALVTINDINKNSSRPLPIADGESVPPAFFVDVTGDRRISPADILAVINYLNSDPLDVDQSRTVDEADALAILKYLQNQDSPNSTTEILPEFPRLDTNRDGKVTTADVLFVVNAIFSDEQTLLTILSPES
jgi:hypothetical protein